MDKNVIHSGGKIALNKIKGITKANGDNLSRNGITTKRLFEEYIIATNSIEGTKEKFTAFLKTNGVQTHSRVIFNDIDSKAKNIQARLRSVIDWLEKNLLETALRNERNQIRLDEIHGVGPVDENERDIFERRNITYNELCQFYLRIQGNNLFNELCESYVRIQGNNNIDNAKPIFKGYLTGRGFGRNNIFWTTAFNEKIGDVNDTNVRDLLNVARDGIELQDGVSN
uniref:DUF1018 domain-containing protein n=1 Tax=Rhabditophanes sp. KR3021 TaxID=114890 RepID=A0AC35TKT5_9BILA